MVIFLQLKEFLLKDGQEKYLKKKKKEHFQNFLIKKIEEQQ